MTIETLRNLIVNVLNNPHESKFKILKTSNQIFQTRILETSE